MKVITQGTWKVGAGDKAKTIESGTRVDHKALGIGAKDVDRYVALGTLVLDAPKAEEKPDDNEG